MFILRIGDGGDYRDVATTEEVADLLIAAESGLLNRRVKLGFEAGEFTGNNYISLFVGSHDERDGSTVQRKIDSSELDEINTRIAESLGPPEFERFDVCEAHHVVEADWHVEGWLRERPTNQRMIRSTSVQLSRMKFEPSACVRASGYEGLTANGKLIYHTLVARYNLKGETVR